MNFPRLLIFSCISAVLFTASFAQLVFADAAVSVSEQPWGGVPSSNYLDNSLNHPGQLRTALASGKGHASGHVSVVVAPGQVGVAIAGFASTSPPASGTNAAQYASVNATAQISYSDRITVTAPNLPVGAKISVLAHLAVEGDVAFPTNSGRSHGALDLVTIVGDHAGSYFFPQGVMVPPEGPGGEQIVFLANLFNGESTSLYLNLLATGFATSVTASTPGMGFVSNNAIHYADTVAWGGLTSFKDEFGNPLSSFVVTSESGIDYVKSYETPPGPGMSPVPESSLIGFYAGIGLVGWVAARQKLRLLRNKGRSD